MSDMLGSVGKSALERYVASNPDFTGRDAEAVAAAMRARLSPATTQFHSIKVVVVPVLERPPKGMGVVVPHIQKMRHITLTPTGTLVARELACHACLALSSSICQACAALPPAFTPAAAAGEEEVGETEEEEEGEDRHLDEEQPDPHQLLGEEDRADAEELGREEEGEVKGQVEEEEGEVEGQVEEEEEEEVVAYMWAQKRRKVFSPCQVVSRSVVPRRTILQSIDLNLTRTLFRILGQFESHSHSNPSQVW